MDELKELDLTSGRVVKAPSFGWFVGIEGEPLLIRESYPKMYDIAWKVQEEGILGKRGLIITGNPGIGKSCLLNYFFIKLIQNGKYILQYSFSCF